MMNLFYSFALVLVLLLTGCSSDTASHDGDALHLNFFRPEALGVDLIPLLQAQASLDGQRTYELQVSSDDNTINGRIDGVTAGEHVLLIRYYVVLASGNITLATVTKNVTVLARQVSELIILDSDLDRNYDNDEDGFTNLDEVNAGSDPNDATEVPN